MTITVDADELYNYAEDVRSYSGRGMYGKYCLAVVFDSMGDFVTFIADIVRDVTEADSEGSGEHPLAEFVNVLNRVSVDSMGLGTVYYWRGVEVTGLDTDSDD